MMPIITIPMNPNSKNKCLCSHTAIQSCQTRRNSFQLCEQKMCVPLLIVRAYCWIFGTQRKKNRFVWIDKNRIFCCTLTMRYIAFSHADPHFLLFFSHYVAVYCSFFILFPIVDRFKNCSAYSTTILHYSQNYIDP